MHLPVDTSGKPLLIVQAGNTFAEISHNNGDFADWIAAGLGGRSHPLRLDARDNPELPPPSTLAGVVVSGSHAMVTAKAGWSERLAEWLKTCVAARTPVLGICYGHQLLAHALGGRVGYRTQGLEIGTHIVEPTANAANDDLFRMAPRSFAAQLVHAQSVLDLPPGATLLAASAEEPHQAFRIGECAWGVQFHPEFCSTVMRGYIRQMASELADSEALLATVRDTPDASALLHRFASKALATAEHSGNTGWECPK